MTVRIGQIELNGVQSLQTEESRTLVEQRALLQHGSVFQDLGRGSVTIVVDGLLVGATALSGLERLRAAQIAAAPLSFAADAVVGSEVTDVLIEDLCIREVAGYPQRYRYTLRLREYQQMPGPAAALQHRIDEGVAADASSWAGSSLAASAVLLNPASLPSALRLDPGILEHLGAADLGQAIATNAERLSGADFSGVLRAVSRIDPGKAADLIHALRDADGLAGFVQKYADEGLDFLSDLTGVDLGDAASLLHALTDGLEFLKRLKEISERASSLAKQLGNFDVLAEIRPLFTVKVAAATDESPLARGPERGGGEGTVMAARPSSFGVAFPAMTVGAQR